MRLGSSDSNKPEPGKVWPVSVVCNDSRKLNVLLPILKVQAAAKGQGQVLQSSYVIQECCKPGCPRKLVWKLFELQRELAAISQNTADGLCKPISVSETLRIQHLPHESGYRLVGLVRRGDQCLKLFGAIPVPSSQSRLHQSMLCGVAQLSELWRLVFLGSERFVGM